MRNIIVTVPFALLAMMVWAAQTVAPAGAPAVTGGAGRIAPMQTPPMQPVQPVQPVRPMPGNPALSPNQEQVVPGMPLRNQAIPNYPRAEMSNEAQQRFYFTNNFHQLTNRPPGFMPVPRQNTMAPPPLPGFQTNGMMPGNPAPPQ